MTAPFIAVDWGTSNFRAFLVDGQTGRCLGEKRSSAGLRALEPEQFPHYCREQLAEWRMAAGGIAPLPIYLAGMVGARSGWVEAPQLEMPLTLEALAANLMPAPGLDNAWLVPGARMVTPSHVDVMRGEEVQAFGALSLAQRPGGLCCLPGTHSKWVSARENTLTHFTTLMTGELFHVLRFHTLVGQPIPREEAFDAAGFEQGLAASRHPSGILHALFEARSRYLHSGLEPEQIGSFLSGVLIGSELAGMQPYIEAEEGVVLVGSRELSESYRQALEIHGLAVCQVEADRASIEGIRLLNRCRAGSAG
ncbi:2-dehydro-3-deoxygalactonokinase [Halomonas daqiaonensis]|uniref:2-keto-3-deoxygalactonate kinase n=1 Tax=Halomonas daqiaonensis TaxID=650850 RepID=A0A1H7TPY3_9GAMM|nr:2-dehydro-3-deoxygalactonokinase [Halomonas daqiaonensis]SEL86932.1 2-keto-3-deoxygalactonate kinase [Halomonas daqiaonensis]